MQQQVSQAAGVAIPPIIEFVCNLCGTPNKLAHEHFHRELPSCGRCGSTPRFRGIVNLLSEGLFKKSLQLSQFPVDRSIKGLGFTDWDGYAKRLQECFDYTNTFYEDTPRLDIMAREIPSQFKDCDFVICSEVFEHVPPPLDRAFSNLHSLLKPGGLLVFSVPTTEAPVTTEHFSGLFDYEIVSFKGKDILINRNQRGFLSVHEDLVFHGGGKTALEMRLYSEQQVVRHLREGGFHQVQTHDRPLLDTGYYWPVGPAPIGDQRSTMWRNYLFTAIAA